MSVYCTSFILSNDPWDDGDLPAPIVYRGSHILPSTADRRGGVLDLAYIPGFITRDGRDDGPEADDVWPYLRVSLTGDEAERDTVLLDADQVLALRDQLNIWLDRARRDQP